MKKSLFSILFLVTILCKGFSQDYATLVKQGYKIYGEKDYEKSVQTFEQAFKLAKPKPGDLYNAACAATLGKQIEKAFSFLDQAVDFGYSNITHLKSDTDLESLHQDRRWQEILLKIEKKEAEELAKLKYPKILKRIDSMEVCDQAIRDKYNDLRKKGGKRESPEMQSMIQEMKAVDSLNMIETKKLFKQYGFLGFEEVGKKGSHEFWLLIQHSDKDPKFQEDVLQEMKKHIERKNANGTDYAYLIDRVNINTGKPQIYGTQTRRSQETGKTDITNLFEPENVNKRRAEVGLGTIEEYLEMLDQYYGAKPKEKPVVKTQ
jgi:hypothetical protein